MLSGDRKVVHLMCTGNNIQRGINLALQLQKECKDLCLETNTLTITSIQDVLPFSNNDDIESNKSLKSSLHIKITRC